MKWVNTSTSQPNGFRHIHLHYSSLFCADRYCPSQLVTHIPSMGVGCTISCPNHTLLSFTLFVTRRLVSTPHSNQPLFDIHDRPSTTSQPRLCPGIVCQRLTPGQCRSTQVNT